MSLAPTACASCAKPFTPARPEVRFCHGCRDKRLGVYVKRTEALREPSGAEWIALGDGSFQRRAFRHA